MFAEAAIDDVNSLNRQSYDAVKDQIPTAQTTVNAYKEVMLSLVDDASAGAKEFKSAFDQDPVNQEKLLSLVQQGKVKFITPKVEGKKLNSEDQILVSQFKKNLVIACAKEPEVLDFTDIIMGVAMRNKMAAASLTFGDWIKLAKKV